MVSPGAAEEADEAAAWSGRNGYEAQTLDGYPSCARMKEACVIARGTCSNQTPLVCDGLSSSALWNFWLGLPWFQFLDPPSMIAEQDFPVPLIPKPCSLSFSITRRLHALLSRSSLVYRSLYVSPWRISQVETWRETGIESGFLICSQDCRRTLTIYMSIWDVEGTFNLLKA